jgi:hypothetical protein
MSPAYPCSDIPMFPIGDSLITVSYWNLEKQKAIELAERAL